MGGGPISYAIPIAVELAGMFLLVLGVSIELTTQAGIGHTLISVGSVLITAGSIIFGKLLRKKR